MGLAFDFAGMISKAIAAREVKNFMSNHIARCWSKPFRESSKNSGLSIHESLHKKPVLFMQSFNQLFWSRAVSDPSEVWRAAIKGTVSHLKHRNCQKELKTIQKFDS